MQESDLRYVFVSLGVLRGSCLSASVAAARQHTRQ